MDILQSIILGAVQGITEWLPISSSGHLVIFQHFFNINVPIFFDVILHLGTLFVVLIVFYKDILNLDKKTVLYLLSATFITAVIGFSFKEILESFFSNILAVGIGLLITGLLLFSTKSKKGKREMNFSDSLLIGLFQGMAIIPGISRSGATISAGILRNLDREKTAGFSFILSIPAILGAVLLEFDLKGIELIPVLTGVLTSIITGYFSVKFLLKIIKKEKFYIFSYYCFFLGFFIILLTFV